ncbi:MAG: SIS domain-containing protein [Spirochaetia bacterium]|jgi:glucosamine--fructose-6-phosphate aminotransferase (isomerizing)
MTQAEFVTMKEITTQTTAWAHAIDKVIENARAITALDIASYRQVLCVGCGSTYYLALSTASLLQSRACVIARAFPASELLLNPLSVYVEGRMLLIAISRSGATSETLRIVADFKARRLGTIVVLTNDGDSPLARHGDIVLSIEDGQEVSVAQTRSFASMFVAASAVSDILGPNALFLAYKDALIDRGSRLIHDEQELARDMARNRKIRQVFFLGSGPRLGLAKEVSLKLKEMSQTVSEPFHFLEFRHGPISMVDEHTLVVGMVSEGGYDHEMAVMKDVRRLGGKTLTLGEKGTDIEWKSGIAEYARNVLYLPVLQLFAYHRAVYLGKNPDTPRNLAAVVELDLGV